MTFEDDWNFALRTGNTEPLQKWKITRVVSFRTNMYIRERITFIKKKEMVK